MLSTVYVACLLAASAAATPARHNARAFSSFSQDAAQADANHAFQASSGPFGSSVSQAASRNSASSHNSATNFAGGAGFGGGLGVGLANGGNAGFGSLGGNGYNAMSANSASANSFNSASINAGGVGGYGGGSFASSQQSFSTSSVSSSFQNLNGMIGGFQSQLAAGQLTQAAAFQRCQQLAQSFQAVLSQASRCDTCFQNPSQFGSVASSTMSQFTSFMSQLQSSFGGSAFGQIASPFSSITSSFQQFFQRSASSSLLTSGNIIPQNFGSVMQGVMPSLIPTLQQLNGNGLNVGGGGAYGSTASSFSSSQQSYSTSSVTSGFQNLNGLIGGVQSQLAAGQLTQALAIQQCQQIAQSFQAVLAQANTCDACFHNGGQFSSVASSTISQFTSFVSQLQSTFDASAFGQIASSFSTLSSSFQQFFQRSSSSSFASSIVPQNFGPVMQSVMPSLMPTIQQLSFQKK